MKTEGSSCQREIASSERKVVLDHSTKQGKKKTANKSWIKPDEAGQEVWVSADRNEFKQIKESGQSHGILVLVKAWYLIQYL